MEEIKVWTFDVIMGQEKQVAQVMEEAGAVMVKDEVPMLGNGEGKEQGKLFSNRK